MLTTSLTLLQRLHDQDASAWERFVSLYSPLVRSWARKTGMQDADVEDLVQDVLAVLTAKLSTFKKKESGSFRGWMKTILMNRYRAMARRPKGKSLSTEELAVQPAPEAEQFWEVEYRQVLIVSALNVMRSDFQEKTWQACWEQVVNEKPAADVARQLDMPLASVYSARSRVLRRLRESLDGLLD